MKTQTRITVEVGHAYICRDGSLFTADSLATHGHTYRVAGEDERGRITWRSLRGRFTSHPHPLDVVGERQD